MSLSHISEERESSVSSGDDWVQQLRADLEQVLDKIKSTGTFASTGEIPNFVLPEIHIPGVGQVDCPLSEASAQAVIAACHQAPFGLGEKTIIDKTVRNTWELNPDKFEIRSPQWQQQLNRIVKQVTTDLGIPSTYQVEAQLYKMLLYEKGAKFKGHTE